VVTVTVAEPAATPVTTPEELTVAMLLLLLDQLTPLFVALEGATVAVSVVVEPTPTLTAVGLTVTPVTATPDVTLMLTVVASTVEPSVAVTRARMVWVPAGTLVQVVDHGLAVTSPNQDQLSYQ
jgi:hypothetical protein